MNLRDVLDAVRVRWRVLVAGLLAGLALASVLSWLSTPLYTSTTQLFVSVAGPKDSATAYQADLFSQQRAKSYVEILTSAPLARQVVEELDLTLTANEVAAKVDAVSLPDTVILEVTVTDTSPERARDIAGSLASQFSAQAAALETPPGEVASTVDISTIQPAELNPVAQSPDVGRNLALGGALGLLVGLALVLMRTRLDPAVKTAQDVRDLTGSDVIGRVPEDPQLGHQGSATSSRWPSRTAEAFRSVRANLCHGDEGVAPGIVIVTSAVPDEGRSTIALGLALASASPERRVALVDADLRRPRIADAMGLAGERGLTEVLDGSAVLNDVTHAWGDGSLTVLTAGNLASNPSELLDSTRMRDVLEGLRKSHDLVIVDTPAVLAVADAAVVGVLADGAVLATRFGTTSQERLGEAAGVLGRVGVRVLGVVLNRVPQASSVVPVDYYETLARRNAPRPRVVRFTTRGAHSRQRVAQSTAPLSPTPRDVAGELS